MGARGLAAICMLAALAVFGASAGSAAAEPVFLTKSVVGEAVSSVPFTATTGASFWEGKTSKAKITCTGGSAVGTVTGAQSLAKVVITLNGCETSGCKINTEGLPEGVIESNVLAGKLNAVTSTLPGVKLFSESEGKGGQLFEIGACGSLVHAVMTGEVTGSLSGAAGSGPETGKLVSSMKLTFAESAGAQKYQGFIEGPEAGLKGQLTATVNGTPELSGFSEIITAKTSPSTWGLGVTK